MKVTTKRIRELRTIIFWCDRLGVEYDNTHSIVGIAQGLNAKTSTKKKKREKSNFAPDSVYENERKITVVNMGSYNLHGMHIFGANVQLSRAIPNIADGFKPVGRRVLYSMARISHADKKLKKALGLQGDVIKIHPHGPSSVEDVLTLFAKPWELNYPLIEIDGNKGNAAGKRAAALRYLDAKLSDYAYDCYFADWDEKLVEMRATYNRDEYEPDYLISKFPDLLLRPSTGFTFGMASNIPSYNLGEAFNAMIELIKDKDYNPILIPDMPCSCVIMDEGKFPEICNTGVGAFKMRGEIEIDYEHNRLDVISIPYQTKLSDVKEKIVALRATCFPNLKDIFDGTDKSGINLELTFRPGTDLDVMKAMLYKKTALESVFGTQMRYVDMQRGKASIYNLKEIMMYWLNNRRNVKRKFYINKFVNGKERVNILEVMIDICQDEKFLQAVIKLIRKSKRDELAEVIHERYPNVSTTQAMGLAKMRLEQFSETALSEHRLELKTLIKNLEEWDKIIHSAKKIDKIIIKELEEAIAKYDTPRKCRIEKYVADEDGSSLISDRDYILVVTRNGYVKKLPPNAKDIGDFNPGDDPIMTYKANNRETIIAFDEKGMVHPICVNDITETPAGTKGVSLSQYIHLAGQIVSILRKDDITEKSHFIFVTKNGMIKKTDCAKFGFKKSVASILLKKDDKLVDVLHGKSNTNVIIYTKKGYGTRFNTNEFQATSRMSGGVIGINLEENDEVIGLTKVHKKDDYIMVMTAKGMGKVCSLDSFATEKRRGSVVQLATLIRSDEIVSVIACSETANFLIIMKNDAVKVPFDEFSELTRNHYGKKVVGVRRGDLIIRCLNLNPNN